MAEFENDSHSNQHTVYVSRSGGGKNQALRENLNSIKGKKRIVCWDTHKMHLGLVCSTLAELGRALVAHYDKSDFCICYQGAKGEANFKIFAEMVWEFARGDKLTYVIVDETADCTESIGKDRTGFGELLRGGRKYGLIVHSTAVSVAEIPNTVWRESDIKFIGRLGNESDRKRCVDSLNGRTVDDIKDLQPLEFLVQRVDGDAEKIKFKYKKAPHRL